MRIGTLARETGVSERLLRYYEEQGLLRPVRLANGYREYDESDVTTVSHIRALLAAGLPERHRHHATGGSATGAGQPARRHGRPTRAVIAASRRAARGGGRRGAARPARTTIQSRDRNPILAEFLSPLSRAHPAEPSASTTRPRPWRSGTEVSSPSA
ncbi:hypothetical protein GCM10023322_07070 [Rugosimonospora acidiphila]|uniref:HTH merR-type domain-containing protein n=1 Tax=Rugosimonospora acidiphila TaxID=556531 RepID=A0ABP9RL16_9ACTN